MKITLKSTAVITTVNGAKCRLWEGETESGIPVFAYIVTIAVHKSQDQTQFESELIEHVEVSPLSRELPLRLWLD